MKERERPLFQALGLGNVDKGVTGIETGREVQHQYSKCPTPEARKIKSNKVEGHENCVRVN